MMPLVILIHGLGRRPGSMAWSARWLNHRGYDTQCLGYPSMRISPEEVAEQIIQPQVQAIVADRGENAPVHFLTHSLGGIVWRAWLRRSYGAPDGRGYVDLPPWLGRTVMLAPPSQGAAVAGRLRELGWPAWIMGPALKALQPGKKGLGAKLGPVPPHRVSVVMGDSPLIPLFRAVLSPEAHDGIVAVPEGQVEGQAAFHVLSADHTFIMRRSAAMELADQFFRKSSPDAPQAL
jgi:triacylglycerol lipase